MPDFTRMSLEELLRPEGYDCPCGRKHISDVKYLKIGRGAVQCVPEAVRTLGCSHPFIVCDLNTEAAAGLAVEKALTDAGIEYSKYCFPTTKLLTPSEWELGSIAMHFDPKSDLLLAVGGGVINDLCKVLGADAHLPVAIVGTAPSMDGFASNSGAMEINRIKTNVYTPTPAAIICDTEIMAAAPMRMLLAGVGDMIAKYVALAEWRISHLINGEYYCESIADMMRAAMAKVVSSVDGVMKRDPEAAGSVAEGLTLAGIAMAFAQVTRPASGVEHCFSHIWEMMALERGGTYDLHGIQVGVGTMLSLFLYDRLRETVPTLERADRAIAEFDEEKWADTVRSTFGSSAEELIANTHKSGRNDPARRRARAEKIIANWNEIVAIINAEVPTYDEMHALLAPTGMPLLPKDLNISTEDAVSGFTRSRDIRDRYLTSSLCWDLGILDDLGSKLEAFLTENR